MDRERMVQERESLKERLILDHQEELVKMNREINLEKEAAMIERKELIARHREEINCRDKK